MRSLLRCCEQLLHTSRPLTFTCHKLEHTCAVQLLVASQRQVQPLYLRSCCCSRQRTVSLSVPRCCLARYDSNACGKDRNNCRARHQTVLWGPLPKVCTLAGLRTLAALRYGQQQCIILSCFLTHSCCEGGHSCNGGPLAARTHTKRTLHPAASRITLSLCTANQDAPATTPAQSHPLSARSLRPASMCMRQGVRVHERFSLWGEGKGLTSTYRALSEARHASAHRRSRPEARSRRCSERKCPVSLFQGMYTRLASRPACCLQGRFCSSFCGCSSQAGVILRPKPAAPVQRIRFCKRCVSASLCAIVNWQLSAWLGCRQEGCARTSGVWLVQLRSACNSLEGSAGAHLSGCWCAWFTGRTCLQEHKRRSGSATDGSPACKRCTGKCCRGQASKCCTDKCRRQAGRLAHDAEANAADGRQAGRQRACSSKCCRQRAGRQGACSSGTHKSWRRR